MFLEAKPWLLYKLSLSGTLTEPASSCSAVFRMIATRDSKKPLNLVTHAEPKASGSIPGNLWHSEQTLVRDNTESCTDYKLCRDFCTADKLCAGPCKIYAFCNNPYRLSEVSLGQQPLVYSIPELCPPPPTLGTWFDYENYLRNCLWFPTLPAPPSRLYIFNQWKELKGLKN